MYRLAGEGDTEGFRVPLGKSGKDILYRKVSDSGEDMLAEELKAFLKAISVDHPIAVTLGEATEALRVALEIEKIGLASIAAVLEAQKT